MLSAQPNDHAVPCINLNRTVRLAIREHGIDRIGGSGALGCQHHIGHIFFQVCPFGSRHCGTLANDLQCDITQSLSAYDASGLQHQRREHTRS